MIWTFLSGLACINNLSGAKEMPDKDTQQEMEINSL
jgi:hypothetical protein